MLFLVLKGLIKVRFGWRLWYGMIIYSGLIFILHMSLNIFVFFIKFFIALFANFGSGGMSDIHLKSVQHRVQSQRTVGALAWRVKMRLGLHDHGKL
jgi:hypothetical protein